MLRSGSHDDEAGFTLVITALMLVGLMVFAALAIDLGAVYGERRIDQNTADASTTSGAIELLRNQSLQSAVTEAVSKTDTDLGRTVSAAEWTACADAGALEHTATDLALTPATQCISFSSGFSRMRVRVPTQDVKASFGRIVGIDSFSSSAFAEVDLGPNGSGALPFVLLAGSNPGDQVCLRVNNSGGDEPPDMEPPAGAPSGAVRELDPCNNLSFATSSGGRGTTLPYLYEACSKPTGNQSIVDAVMVGMDHLLGVYDPAVELHPGDDSNAVNALRTDTRIDGANGCRTALPNALEVDTGFTAQLLKCALIENPCNSGSSATVGGSGRLSAGLSATFAALGVNDKPLWDHFVDPLPAGAPSSCTPAKSSSTEFYLRRYYLLDCLAGWSSGDGRLFTEQIGEEKRLGFVPRIAESGLCRVQPAPGADCSGSTPKHVHLNSFSPVYLDGIYQDKGGTCDTSNPATPTADAAGWSIHYPGKGLKCGKSTGHVHRLSAVVVPCGSLPASICDPASNPSFPDTLGMNSVRLSK